MLDEEDDDVVPAVQACGRAATSCTVNEALHVDAAARDSTYYGSAFGCTHLLESSIAVRGV